MVSCGDTMTVDKGQHRCHPLSGNGLHESVPLNDYQGSGHAPRMPRAFQVSYQDRGKTAIATQRDKYERFEKDTKFPAIV
jgi:hypothetical protein